MAESVEPSGPSLFQATGDAVPPRGDEIQQNATQPVDAPCVGTATQPVQTPGAGPDVLPSGTGDAALSVDQTLTSGRVVQSTSGSESEEDQHSEAGSLLEGNFRDGSPDGELTRDESADQELSEEASYRETIRGVRSFMGWHKVPEFESVSSSDDNPFAGSSVQPTSKVSVKLLVDDWLCKKMEKLNLTITEGYPARNTETAGLLKDQFIKPPRSSRWCGIHTEKKDCDNTTVCSWSPEPAKLNSSLSRVARHSLPTAPPSRALSQDMLRHWERSAREQTVMCNQAAGLSGCLTRVLDAMSFQLKTLHLDSMKGKSSERMKQAVDELDYLVTFNRSISQVMARTMQDLSEGVFIGMANFTLARRDSYLEYLHAGVKQDALTALCTAPVHLHSLFPDQLITKAEEEIYRNEERRSSGHSHRCQGCFHPYAPSDKSVHQPDWKSGNPAWKQIRDRQQAKKSRGKPSTFSQKPAKGSKSLPSRVNDNQCVEFVAGLKDSVYVSGQIGLNPSPVIAGDKKVTIHSHVDFCVANAHSVTGLPQKKGVNPNYCYNHTEIKYVKDVSCVGHLSSANLVTNVPTVAIDPPVGVRLHNFWEKWEALGSSPKVVTILSEGYTLPFRFRPNLTRSPTVISNYHNPSKQAHLLEALYQLVNKIQ